MTPGYMDDAYYEPPTHARRRRITQNGQTSQRLHRARPRPEMGYPPPPPPRSRARAPAREYDYDRGYEDDNYRDRDYYDRDYDHPPRSRPRRAPAAYYDDDYEPPRRSRQSEREPRRPPPTENGGGGSKALAAIVIIFIFLLIFLMFRGPIIDFFQNLSDNPPSLRYQEFPDGVDFTVTKDMELQASGSDQDSISYTLKSACPKDYVMGDFYLQDVKEVRLNPTPNTGAPDFNDRSQEIMIWQEDNFLGTRNFEATYTIRTRFYQWELTEEDSGVIRDIPQALKDRYNHDEWPVDVDRDGVFDPGEDDIDNDGKLDYKIEVSNPRIQQLAKELQDGNSNVYTIVKNIYEYLTRDDVLNYIPSSQGLPKDCITTLNQKKGDCDDYSILLISLCRAVDIPAWLELGVLYDRTQRHWGGHGWAKVAIPFDDGWTAATIDVVNKQFLIHDPYRFVEWIDTGGDINVNEGGEITQVNNLDYYYHSFSYLSYGSPRITSPDTNNFETVDISEFGDTHKIPVEGEPGSEVCMLPGFEVWTSILALVTITFVIAAASSDRKRN